MIKVTKKKRHPANTFDSLIRYIVEINSENHQELGYLGNGPEVEAIKTLDKLAVDEVPLNLNPNLTIEDIVWELKGYGLNVRLNNYPAFLDVVDNERLPFVHERVVVTSLEQIVKHIVTVCNLRNTNRISIMNSLYEDEIVNDKDQKEIAHIVRFTPIYKYKPIHE